MMKRRVLFSVILALSNVSFATGVPGLYQKIYSGSNVTTGDPSVGGVIIPVGAGFSAVKAGNPSITFTSEDTTYTLGANQTIAYKGVMFFEGGKTYRFAKSFDDNGCIKIVSPDGATTNTVLNHTTWNTIGYGSFVPTKSGWYGIDLRLGNGSGGVGPATAPFTAEPYASLLWNDVGLDAVTTDNRGQWHRFVNDETEGTYLYTEVPYTQQLLVTGSPEKLGDIEYGVSYPEVGSLVERTAFEGVWTAPDEKMKATCIGYEIYTNNADGVYVLMKSGTATTCSFTMPDLYVKLVWKFSRQFPLAVSAGEHGTVSDVSGWITEGTVVSPTVTPDSGYAFFKWSESQGNVMLRDTSFAVKGPLTLSAVFAPLIELSPGEDVIKTAVAEHDTTTPDNPVVFSLASGIYSEHCPTQDWTRAYTQSKYLSGTKTNLCGWSCVNLEHPIRIVGASGDPADVTVKFLAYKGVSDNVGRVFFLNHPDAAVEGVTITGGSQGWTASSRWTVGVNGSNVLIAPSGGTVADCIISGGSVSLYGTLGGACAMQAGRLARTKVTGASGNAAAIYATGGVVENCLITKCTTGGGDGVVMLGGTARMVNSTIAGNTGSGASSGVKASATARAVNCAIFNNTTATDTTGHQHVWIEAADSFDHCAGEILINGSCYAGAAGFTDAPNGDYSIGPSSICFEHARAYVETDAQSSVDLGGEQRVKGQVVDIGAYEVDSSLLSVDFSWSVDKGIVPVSVVFSATAVGVTGSASYEWDFDGDGVVDETTDTPTASHTYETPSYNTVSLTLKSGGSEATALHENCVYAAPAVMYVDDADTTPTFPYDRPEMAAANLTDVLPHLIDGMTVVMQPGLYAQTAEIVIDKDVRIIGATGNPRDVVLKFTGDWEKAMRINSADALLANLVVSNRWTSGDVWVSGISVGTFGGTISNCVITACRGNSYYIVAAGVYMINGLLTHSIVENCWFTGVGAANPRGMAVYASGSARVENCLFRNFDASKSPVDAGGDIVVCASSGSVIRNCTAVDSLVSRYARDTITNTATSAFNCTAGLIENCAAAGVVYAYAGVTNAAPWHGSGTFSHCGFDVSTLPNDTCTSITSADFKDYANGDYQPMQMGGLYNKGATVANPPATDFAGKKRVVGKSIDIGCYEQQSLMGLRLILR